ncbi:MAG: rod shape-determining protein RodA [bacterium]
MQMYTKSRPYDWLLLLVVLGLSLGGLFHLYTISFAHQSYYFFRQIAWVGIGVGLLFLFSYLRISFWEKVAYPFYLTILITLLLVLFRGEGAHGAQRWLKLGIFSFQPSEFAKLSLIIVLAKLLGTKDNIGWRQIALSFCFIFPFLVLVGIQPDLGSALIFLPLWLAMLFLAGVSLGRLLVVLGIGTSSVPLFYLFLRPYQKMRILAFLDPGRDPLGTGWAALQSKIALGSGKLMGKGIGGALHTQLSFLPQPFTDFVFASIGEEWGFIGTGVLLGLYFLIVTRGIKIARQSTSGFTRLVSGGVITLLFFQVFITVGMAAGIMPVTGMPLPLVSYGGSSIIMFLLGIGLLLSVKRYGE